MENEYDDDLNQFNLSLKKKKKREKKVKDEKDEKDEKETVDDDYDYTFLLERVFGNLRQNHPTLSSHKKLVVPPPQVISLSSKKTMIGNFYDIVRILDRSIDHIQTFFMSELNTNCNIDSMSRMIIKGKYIQKQIESIFKKYINEYVLCSSCNKSNTSLIKDPITRIYFLKCEVCNSSKSVQTIKNNLYRV